MCPHDAAEHACITIHQETRQECIQSTQLGHYQGTQEREEGTKGSLKWRDHHAYSSHEVRFPLDFIYQFQSQKCGCRPNTSDFIAQQLQIMTAMQAEQEQRAQQSE